MNGWDISCINNRVVTAITSQDALVARCKGMEYFIVILIIFLLKKRNHLKREEGGIDATSKDAPPICHLDGVCARTGTSKK